MSDVTVVTQAQRAKKEESFFVCLRCSVQEEKLLLTTSVAFLFPFTKTSDCAIPVGFFVRNHNSSRQSKRASNMTASHASFVPCPNLNIPQHNMGNNNEAALLLLPWPSEIGTVDGLMITSISLYGVDTTTTKAHSFR